MQPSETLRTRTWKRKTFTRAQNQSVDYEPVPCDDRLDDENDDETLNVEFHYPSVKIPWAALVFAAILCFGGGVLLAIAILLLTGYIDSKYIDRIWPLVVLGLIMFIPGAYHMRIALFAFLNRPGYSFDDIPDFD